MFSNITPLLLLFHKTWLRKFIFINKQYQNINICSINILSSRWVHIAKLERLILHKLWTSFTSNITMLRNDQVYTFFYGYHYILKRSCLNFSLQRLDARLSNKFCWKLFYIISVKFRAESINKLSIKKLYYQFTARIRLYWDTEFTNDRNWIAFWLWDIFLLIIII